MKLYCVTDDDGFILGIFSHEGKAAKLSFNIRKRNEMIDDIYKLVDQLTSIANKWVY